MALNTVSELDATAADYLNRSDLTPIIPTFRALAEVRLNRELRTRFQETQVTLSTVAGTATVPLPDDYLEARGLVRLTASPADLSYRTPASLSTLYGANSGMPAAYTVIGSNIKFGPVPDAVYSVELTYLAKVPPLSDANPTNWVLTNSPDLYIYATLLESAPYLKEDARLTVWGQLYDAALGRVQQQDERARWPSSPLSIQVTKW
ncbi:hypothetical protein CRT60_00295 [Azospirillum palustre]|uniref:Uncharacterized protein n=1 Tax=Azospirillum palustre TaxID=2044885 RepID=A0A2B8BQF3_9PROT|nr:hypothetical protein [Azospirillum palustre]PGH59457.1 hypothetical protein CRT60_00295 [Azospirillum palustre]